MAVAASVYSPRRQCVGRARDRTHVGDYLNELRADVTELENATDPDVDPSTKRMCRRIACEVDLLLEEANRLGVDL